MAKPRLAGKTDMIASLAANVLVAVMELGAMIYCAANQGASMFGFYTQDSNIFAMIACMLCAYYTARALGGKADIPEWVHSLRYFSVSCLAVTFVVVVTVLAPASGIEGYGRMLFGREMLFTHFLCPVIAMVSFIMFEKKPPLTKIHNFYAIVPTIIYAAITLTLNIASVMRGPYPFLLVYEQPVYMSVIWAAAILGGAYILAWAIRKLNAINVKK